MKNKRITVFSAARNRREKLRAVPGSVCWAIGALGATALFGSLGIVISWFVPYRVRYAIFSRWSLFLVWWARVCCGIRWEVEGLEHKPSKPCVVLAKHQSAWETLALQAWFAPQTWVLKQELTRIPLIGWAIRMLQPIAIDRQERKEAMQQMLEQGERRLRDGIWVVVYPEGTRVPPGRSGRYQRGGAVLAAETGAAMILVAHNAGECWPKNSFLKYPGTIRVRISRPVETRGRDVEGLLKEAKDWIESNTRAVSSSYESDERAAGGSPN